jgi:hypothetical protein
MQPLAEQILAHAATLPEGAAVRAKELLHLGSRAGVDQALARLERAGALSRISRGLYVRPSVGRFGPRAPSPAKVVTALASATGETITPHGAVAANALGLTTQTPLRPIYLTSGRTRQFKVAGQLVELRHAPEWELLLPGQAAGDALRAIAWAGRARAQETVSLLRQRLGPGERQSLLSLRGRLPTWLAQEVSNLAHG